MHLNSRKRVFAAAFLVYLVSVSSYFWSEIPVSIPTTVFIWGIAPVMALFEFRCYAKGQHMNFMELHANENSGEARKVSILCLNSILLISPLIYKFRVPFL